mmetsp:Transcript_39710/g.102177  ORF Transcript_39710/g.102177 Transcript_39710/m.102177 type:complete len:100 (+) Transcript_39710:203-502(+)
MVVEEAAEVMTDVTEDATLVVEGVADATLVVEEAADATSAVVLGAAMAVVAADVVVMVVEQESGEKMYEAMMIVKWRPCLKDTRILVSTLISTTIFPSR